ncbi:MULTISPECIES: hypothetical protein [Pseudonocardia]|uniref:MarR family protein n=2 Tax=Pseudonocardia TaxID=1847 RepID=A0A1Y2MU11_PSEAH|nr:MULTISPECIES: hypothetical protein [Pseudonocardia]OSY38078.1 hypothetical protein BG845_04251 [Pseudonocardia autotrophica]TDN75519.1 hypothetical protein C8E95_4696 [Pseudonocardia autotrophica]BBF99488.1 hypothetical protein Pdca_06980 [Pseudonocardia autotrophica]GEC28489.1 hypothetical protein PSA01_55180 [Pseudonocardia saturnea]
MIAFGTQLVGRTEKALNALLLQELAGTGLDEHRWIALTLTTAGGDDVTGRIARALRVDRATATARLAELAASGLVRIDGPEMVATPRGVALRDRIVAAIGRITADLWGDLPADDLAVAGDVLRTVLSRAEVALAAR